MLLKQNNKLTLKYVLIEKHLVYYYTIGTIYSVFGTPCLIRIAVFEQRH